MLENGLIPIAGVMDQAEAELLQQCGIKYLGFPLHLPVHRADLTEQQAAEIIQRLPPPVFGVLITYLDGARSIVDCCRALGVRIVQLHGDVDTLELEQLKHLDPDLTVIKSLIVGRHGIDTLEATMRELSPFVDAYITDTFDLCSGASGATGKTHDWTVSRRLAERSDRPVILAGGLTPDNVRAAIRQVRPAGVDAHTGVEDASGRKSREKVEKFVAKARAAFAAL